MFEPLKNFLPRATTKLHFGPQAQAGLICTQARKVIADHYGDYEAGWTVMKFQNHTLFVRASDHSSASALRMRTQSLLERFAREEVLGKVLKLKIVVV